MAGSQAPYRRAERVADVLRQIVSEILIRRIHHAGLEDITVTAVNVSNDLQHAKIFYRVMDLHHKDQAAKALTHLTSSVRRELAAQLKMRYTPALRFEYDESFDYGNRIDRLLKSIQRPSGKDEE